ncbi:MAG: ATP-binding protein [Janthinobacterium lividum]
MKQLLLLLAWVSASTCFAQTPDTAAPRVPRSGLLLGKAWRYHAGDNPAWARPGFDASAWDTLTLNQPARAMPPATQAGVCWLRRRFRLADSLRQRSLVLQCYRLGTADVYLNGRLLTDSTHCAQVQGFWLTPGLLEVPANGPAEQVLAVRFVPRHLSPLLVGADQLHPLNLWLVTGAQQQQREVLSVETDAIFWIMSAVFLLLTLLHYTFYLYNPTQRANRYFARYALAYCLEMTCVGYSVGGRAVLPSWGWGLAASVAENALLFASALCLLRAMYSLFGFAPSRVYVGLMVTGGLLLLVTALIVLSPWSLFPFLTFGVFVLAEALRLTGLALRQRRRGARIIAAGYGGGLLFILLYLGLQLAGVPLSLLVSNLLPLPGILLPALGISFFLAREFALDAELLLVKLHEVEQLSAQTLAQEQDKQALLAAQNETLETQVAERTSALQRSLTELQATQQQLIQKEKMASLGELTAGIAHEIQNPLNFVNNFAEVSAEVSAELVAELQEAQAAGDGAEVVALADDLGQNMQKITEHGKRAAGIVRGMLEHSRQSTGERQPTDVNALCDEYLRLAYHGLRAKDKTFNATLHTDFAPTLPLVEAVPGDLGRVLLNLLTNAFYAVRQRQQAGEPGYAPTVSVRTSCAGRQVHVAVRDNGPGMSEAVRAKVFQPFFTTKPAGEGTGLGLSLSYDIVTQGHGRPAQRGKLRRRRHRVSAHATQPRQPVAAAGLVARAACPPARSQAAGWLLTSPKQAVATYRTE